MQTRKHPKRSNRRPWQLAKLLDLEIQDIIKACSESGVIAKENDLLEPEVRDAVYSVLKQRKDDSEASAISEKKLFEHKKDIPKPTKEPKLRYQSELPKIGPIVNIENVDYLEARDIKSIHAVLVKHFSASKDPIEPPGVRDENLLESAASRPHTSLGKQAKYLTIPYIGAAYLHSIICNHPFHNGNKRTALVSLLSFLDLNKYILYTKLSEDDIYQTLIDIASKKLRSDHETYDDNDREIIGVAHWLRPNLRNTRAKDPILKWGQLQKILGHYGCEISAATTGNAWNIKKGNKRTQISVRNDGHDVDRETMRHLRSELNLMPADGYPSFIFYGKEQKVPDFINKYKDLLSKLAKT